MASPFLATVNTFVGGAGAAQSGNVTFSFYNTAGFEAYVPIQITCPGTTSISAGAEVTFFRSTDAGANWETQGSVGGVFAKPTTAGQVQRLDITLPCGQFLIAVQVGGGSASTWTAQCLTAQVLTAYN